MPRVAPGDLAISTNNGPEAFVTVSKGGKIKTSRFFLFVFIRITSLESWAFAQRLTHNGDVVLDLKQSLLAALTQHAEGVAVAGVMQRDAIDT